MKDFKMQFVDGTEFSKSKVGLDTIWYVKPKNSDEYNFIIQYIVESNLVKKSSPTIGGETLHPYFVFSENDNPTYYITDTKPYVDKEVLIVEKSIDTSLEDEELTLGEQVFRAINYKKEKETEKFEQLYNDYIVESIKRRMIKEAKPSTKLSVNYGFPGDNDKSLNSHLKSSKINDFIEFIVSKLTVQNIDVTYDSNTNYIEFKAVKK